MWWAIGVGTLIGVAVWLDLNGYLRGPTLRDMEDKEPGGEAWERETGQRGPELT